MISYSMVTLFIGLRLSFYQMMWTQIANGDVTTTFHTVREAYQIYRE